MFGSLSGWYQQQKDHWKARRAQGMADRLALNERLAIATVVKTNPTYIEKMHHIVSCFVSGTMSPKPIDPIVMYVQ